MLNSFSNVTTKQELGPQSQYIKIDGLNQITIWTRLLLMFWHNRLLPKKIVQTWTMAAKRIIRRHKSIKKEQSIIEANKPFHTPHAMTKDLRTMLHHNLPSCHF